MDKNPQKSDVQSEIESTKIEKDLYVNAPTLELIQRRLEASIKNAFWRWLGLPIGGISFVAIVGLLWTLPGYVDKHVGTIISNLPNFQQTVQEQTQNYLNDQDKGGLLIQGIVTESAVPHIEAAVTKYFKGSEGEERIKPLVVEYMKTERGRKQISSAIDQAIEPLRNDLSSALKYMLNDFLLKVDNPLIFPNRSQSSVSSQSFVRKGSSNELRIFLENSATQIKEGGRPFFLTIIRTDNIVYGKRVIRMYVQKLREFFGTQFEAVLLEGKQREFIGLISLPEFEQLIADDGCIDAFVHWLNSRSDGQLTQWFDQKVTKYASTEKNIIELLSNSESWRSRAVDEPIAVLDSDRHFLGITSRSKILNQLVISVLSAIG